MAVLRLFAAAREAAGVARVELEGETVAQVIDAARARYGEKFSGVVAMSRIWVNGQPADESTAVGSRDVVAVLPPVSGGSGAPAQDRRRDTGPGPGGMPGYRFEPTGGPRGAPGSRGGPATGTSLLSRPPRLTEFSIPQWRPPAQARPASPPVLRTGPPAPSRFTTAPRPPLPSPPRHVPAPGVRAPGLPSGSLGSPDAPAPSVIAGLGGLSRPPSPVRRPPTRPSASPRAAARPTAKEAAGAAAKGAAGLRRAPVPPPVPFVSSPATATPPAVLTLATAPAVLAPEPVAPEPVAPEPVALEQGRDTSGAASRTVERAGRTPRPILTVVQTSDRPHGRRGVIWATVTVGAVAAGQVWLALWLGTIAFVAAAQAASVWRSRGERPMPLVAASTAAALTGAAAFGVRSITTVTVVALLTALITRMVAQSRSPARDVALTMALAVPVGLAAGSIVLLRSIDVQAPMLLLAYMAVYDASAYLVGTGASSAWEGPAAGVAALIPLTLLASLLFVPPFDGMAPLVLGLLAGLCAPLGPLAGSALLGDGAVQGAPALRRLDSLLVMGPLWAWSAAAFLHP